MHARRAILEAIRTQLAGATSPALTVFERDQTATGAPCWQIAERTERREDGTSKARYERLLEFQVIAWGSSPTERDSLSETLESALLGDFAGTLELEWVSVALASPEERAGQRVYPAVYELTARYFTDRS